MLTVYHIYLTREGAEKWFALGLLGDEQARTLGHAFPEITRIETWLGTEVYRARQKRTVH